MQAASHGARAKARNIPSSTRNIHIPAFNPSSPGGAAAKRVLLQARQLLSRAFLNLTAPGLGSHIPATARSAHTGAQFLRVPSIQQRLGQTYRHALSRPLQVAQYIPRGPIVPRGMTQVGLGTARNFSSGRVLFENIVQNVPIAGRAFVEADWDLHLQKERANMQKALRQDKKQQKNVYRGMKENKIFTAPKPVEVKEPEVSEMNKYFSAPAMKPVTTALLIPLAPTPTQRMPLPLDTSPHESLLPLPTLASLHNGHELHALRVSALFSRLDDANVWDRGVKCSAYGTQASAEGVCTILKVEFEGWTKAEVRSVIGESGTGWCVLEETNLAPEKEEEEDELALSDISSEHNQVFSEPASSLVLPTLDFSSSFSQRSFSRTASDEDLFSDFGSDSSFGMESMPGSPTTSDAPSNGWFMLSSDFTRRAAYGETPEPREGFTF